MQWMREGETYRDYLDLFLLVLGALAIIALFVSIDPLQLTQLIVSAALVCLCALFCRQRLLIPLLTVGLFAVRLGVVGIFGLVHRFVGR